MNIYYQWEPWAYSNLASIEVSKLLDKKIGKIEGKVDFLSVWDEIEKGNIWVLPVENGYAGSIHENLHYFLRYDYKIIGEFDLEVKHCLLSLENDIKNVKQAFSHPQALNQCHNFLKDNNIQAKKYSDTAWAAKYISENKLSGVWAIASSLAWEIYWLNILKENIADQKSNTTKFFVIAKKNEDIKFEKKSNKISIIFEARNIPASLYKCLWAFATNNVNLTKIESMPNLKNPFSYIFFMSFEGQLKDENIKKALEELEFFTNTIKILWEY